MGGACSQKLKPRRGMPSSSGRLLYRMGRPLLYAMAQSASKTPVYLAVNLECDSLRLGVAQIWGGSFLPSVQAWGRFDWWEKIRVDKARLTELFGLDFIERHENV